jgi:hypothetical protein
MGAVSVGYKCGGGIIGYRYGQLKHRDLWGIQTSCKKKELQNRRETRINLILSDLQNMQHPIIFYSYFIY